MFVHLSMSLCKFSERYSKRYYEKLLFCLFTIANLLNRFSTPASSGTGVRLANTCSCLLCTLRAVLRLPTKFIYPEPQRMLNYCSLCYTYGRCFVFILFANIPVVRTLFIFLTECVLRLVVGCCNCLMLLLNYVSSLFLLFITFKNGYRG